MAVTNVEIAGMLNKLADLLEIEGENPFRVRTYRNAVRLVESTPGTLPPGAGSGRASGHQHPRS
jgi:DNA polymerase/3'-5' exonuclease PolX